MSKPFHRFRQWLGISESPNSLPWPMMANWPVLPTSGFNELVTEFSERKTQCNSNVPVLVVVLIVVGSVVIIVVSNTSKRHKKRGLLLAPHTVQWDTSPWYHLIVHGLTHWGRDKMAAIFQTTFSNVFSWMKMLEFRLKFHWSLFLRVQLTTFQRWFR